MARVVWTKDDEKILIDMYEDKSQEEVLDALSIDVKWSQVKDKARYMKLKRDNSLARRRYSDEYLLDSLLALSEKLGKTPTVKDVESIKGFPSRKVYEKRFGSWNDALRLLGLELNLSFDHTKESIIKEVKTFYKKNNRSPFHNEMSFSITVWRNFFDSWNELLEECELPVNLNYHNLKSEEDGIKYLIRLKDDLGRVPNSYDVEKSGINRNWFAITFGSWKDALYQAGLINKEELELTPEKENENSINFLVELSLKLNRIPTVLEFEDYLKDKRLTINRKNLCDRLDMTFTEICIKYLPKEILDNTENLYLNKDNVRCRSLEEVKISNMLIDNGLTLAYEPKYSEVTNNEYNYRFDWRINDVYVEYFGLFSEYNNIEHNEFLKNYKDKTFEKIKICNDRNIKLISIFPKDLTYNYRGLINKFKEFGYNVVATKDRLNNNKLA